MVENKKEIKVIKVGKEPVEVTDVVYKAYYKIENHETYMKRLDIKNKLIYIGWTEIFSDIQDPEISLLDRIIKQENSKELANCLSALSDNDKKLIHDIYYEQKSLRQIAREQGVYENTIRYKHNKILKLLKSLLIKYCA